MEYGAYILFSEKLAKYYVGFTSDMDKRLVHHNSGQDRFSRRGVPWNLVIFVPCDNKQDAMMLERKIKNMGAKRFLSSQGM